MTYDVRFPLNVPSEREVSSEMGGVQISLSMDAKEIVVKGVEAQSVEEARAKARRLANDFLSQLSWQHNFTAGVVESGTSVESQPNPSTPKTTNHFLCDDLRVDVTTRRQTCTADGVLASDSWKPGKIPAVFLPAAAHFRKAGLSSDTFDKYRNFYLAIEAAASELAVTHEKGKLRDRELAEFALDVAFRDKLDRLRSAAMGVAGLTVGDDVVKGVTSFLYEQNRCALMHAKKGRDKKVPFDPRPKPKSPPRCRRSSTSQERS